MVTLLALLFRVTSLIRRRNSVGQRQAVIIELFVKVTDRLQVVECPGAAENAWLMIVMRRRIKAMAMSNSTTVKPSCDRRMFRAFMTFSLPFFI
jgi:hypothetical protein